MRTSLKKLLLVAVCNCQVYHVLFYWISRRWEKVTPMVSPFFHFCAVLHRANRQDGKAEKKFLQRSNGLFSFWYFLPSFKTQMKLKDTNMKCFRLYLARWMANYCEWVCLFSEKEKILSFTEAKIWSSFDLLNGIWQWSLKHNIEIKCQAQPYYSALTDFSVECITAKISLPFVLRNDITFRAVMLFSWFMTSVVCNGDSYQSSGSLLEHCTEE